MKTFVTFTSGHQEVENMGQAIEVAKKNDANYIVEIDDEKLPDNVSIEDCIYSKENEAITKTYSW